MPIILGASSAATGAFTVDNSCCFNDGDSSKMLRVMGTATDNLKFTFNCWFKRCTLGTNQAFAHARTGTSGPYFNMMIGTDDKLRIYGPDKDGLNDFDYKTDRVLRDVGAWYCVTIAMDTSLGAAGDRLRIYINGVEETSFTTETNPTQNIIYVGNYTGYDFGIGANLDNSLYWDGYIAEAVKIDGLQLTATSFGEFDEDSPTIWKPIDVSGLTFGNNGFYLDFEDSSNLGNDASGGTDFTETNIIAADQCQDSPTNSFCTMNPLDNATSTLITYANGNNQAFQGTTSAWRSTYGTMAPSSGKWYYECIGGNSSGHLYAAIASPQYAAQLGVNLEMGTTNTQPSYGLYGANGSINYSTTSAAGQNSAGYSGTFTESNYIGVYFDLDNNKIYWAIDGTIQNSGTGFGIEADFAYMPAASLYNNTAAGTGFNFGNGAFNGAAITGTTYNDANGYGIFKYSPNDGGAASFDSSAKDFLAVCTKNLAEYG